MDDHMEMIIRETLSGRPAPRVSPGLAARVLERLERRERRNSSAWDGLAFLACFWSLVLVVSAPFLSGRAVTGPLAALVFVLAAFLPLAVLLLPSVVRTPRQSLAPKNRPLS